MDLKHDYTQDILPIFITLECSTCGDKLDLTHHLHPNLEGLCFYEPHRLPSLRCAKGLAHRVLGPSFSFIFFRNAQGNRHQAALHQHRERHSPDVNGHRE